MLTIINTSADDVKLKRRHLVAQATIVDEIKVNEVTAENIKLNNNSDLENLLRDKLSQSDLTTEESKEKLRALLEEYKDIFENKLKEPGRAGYEHHIYVEEGVPPIKRRPYRYSEKENKVIEEEIIKMEEQGVIEPSSGPWSAPIVLVKKKDGTRFCVDYRGLNNVTKKDVYPLPRIEEVLEKLGGSCIFTIMDMISGYWQIPMADEDKEKTAFISPKLGTWQFRVMPFGLTNAPATFQRHMDIILSGLNWKLCLVYIDDIIVFSPSFDRHLIDLKLVFDRIREAGMYVKLSKCAFAKNKIPFLGHVVSGDGISVDPNKTKIIEDARRPKNVAEIRSFLGLTGYYRRFVQNYALISSPLVHLTKSKIKFVWTDEQENAFFELKKRLVNAPILAYPIEGGKFKLYTDASDVALGGVLSQVQNNEEKVIVYASRKLTNPESRYTVTERECLSIVHFTKLFRHYLYGDNFEVVTDHSALKWLDEFKDLNSRLLRWSLKLQEFRPYMTVTHRPGKAHANADALSRPPIADSETVIIQTAEVNTVNVMEDTKVNVNSENPE